MQRQAYSAWKYPSSTIRRSRDPASLLHRVNGLVPVRATGVRRMGTYRMPRSKDLCTSAVQPLWDGMHCWSNTSPIPPKADQISGNSEINVEITVYYQRLGRHSSCMRSNWDTSQYPGLGMYCHTAVDDHCPAAPAPAPAHTGAVLLCGFPSSGTRVVS